MIDVPLSSSEHSLINCPSIINEPICFSPHLYRARNLIERFFNKIKQCRRVRDALRQARGQLPRLRPARNSNRAHTLLSGYGAGPAMACPRPGRSIIIS
jgi:transposase